MIKLYIEKLPRIIKNKKQLEKALNLKISNRGKEVYIEGTPENEYLGEKVIEAINFGFPISHALTIKQKELMFEIINIKDYTKRKDLERIRGRIIGKQGRTLKTISQVGDCFLEIKDNEVGIITSPENMKKMQESIVNLIQGSKTSNVYKRLEKTKTGPILDLGLKE
jgi:ribosomal RNA assembly protein